MKRFIITCAVLAFAWAAHADIIVLRSGENIEDVKVTTVAYDEVTYNLNGKQTTIASSDVEGVLYDDGRFVTPPSQPVTQTVESTQADDSWAIEDAGNENLKASSTGRTASKSEVERRQETRTTARPVSQKGKKVIPAACYNEANEAFKSTYDEAYNRALNQGYNKFQAASIASDAAQNVKLQVLDECYERRVVQYDDQNYSTQKQESYSTQEQPDTQRQSTPVSGDDAW